MTVQLIEGPLICSSDLDAHRRVFCDGFNMEEVSTQSFDQASTAKIFGVSGRTSEVVGLRTPGVPFGVRLVRFSPDSEIVIRDESKGHDAHAPKVIDFYSPDFDAAIDHLESKGFKIRDAVAEYENGHGLIKEAHMWGPDSVVCAVIAGPHDYLKQTVTVSDRLFSEPHSISGPVTDQNAAVAFYRDGPGLGVVSSYGLDDKTFDALVGGEQRIHLSAQNIGMSVSTPYFGIIHYGLPVSAYDSLLDTAKLPSRGLIGATLLVTDIESIIEGSVAAGGSVQALQSRIDLQPYGDVESAIIVSPFGTTLHLVQAT